MTQLSSNAQKLPFARSLNKAAEQKALSAIQVLGKSLPCKVEAVSGSIVTVSFQLHSDFTLPDVTCPMFGPEYIRYPTQIGDKGVVIAIDAYIGGISGLGGGIADLSLRANLSTLVFFPIASKNWITSDDPNKIVLYGPDGAILRDTASSTTLDLDAVSGVTINASGGAVLNANLVQAVDDGAAAAEGVPVNGLYHDVNAVRIRVA